MDDATRREDYDKTLKRSGYQERISHVKISDALKSHAKMVKNEAKGKRPFYRPMDYQEKES